MQDLPPCFVEPPKLYLNQRFPNVLRGKAPLVKPPFGIQGNAPLPPHPPN
jgi:hypothetical protein